MRWCIVVAIGLSVWLSSRWLDDRAEGTFWLIYIIAAPCYCVWLIVLEGRLSKTHRELMGRCPTCGYDLRASPERCPECGTEVGHTDDGAK